MSTPNRTPRQSERLNKGKLPSKLRDYHLGSPKPDLNLSSSSRNPSIPSDSDDDLDRTVLDPNLIQVSTEDVQRMDDMLQKIFEEMRLIREEASADRAARVVLETRFAKLSDSVSESHQTRTGITVDPNASASQNLNASASSETASNANGETVQQDRQVMHAPPDVWKRVHDLPAFSGKPVEWPRFKAAFNQSTAQYKYSDLDNLFRLQKCLSGEAEKCVASLLIYPQSVSDAMSVLEERFGNAELLVLSQIEVAKALPTISDGNLQMLVPFASTVRNLAYFLDTPETQHYLSNPTIICELSKKLPTTKRIEWAEAASAIKPFPTVKDFSEWINRKAKYVNMVDFEAGKPIAVPVDSNKSSRPSTSQPQTGNRRNNNRNTALLAKQFSDSTGLKCIFCKDTDQKVSSCSRFANLSSSDRWDEVKEKRLCTSCLKPGHSPRTCRSRKRCGVHDCDRFHHKLLHEESNRSSKTTTNNNNEATPKPSETCSGESSRGQTHEEPGPSSDASRKPNPFNRAATNFHVGLKEPELMFRVLPVKLFGPSGVCIDTFALFDEGSSVTMIDEEIADRLALQGETKTLSLHWFGNKSTSEPSRIVNLQISGTAHNHKQFDIANAHTIRGICLPLQTLKLSDLHSRHQHLKNLPIHEYINADPKILIGLDNCHLGIPKKTIIGDATDPIAAKTKLGWLVYGPRSSSKFVGHNRAIVLHQQEIDSGPSDSDLHRIVQEYFTTENFGVNKTVHELESDVDKHARETLERTTVRIGDRFQTGLLWKSLDICLPSSRRMAEKRLVSIEAKMRRDPNYAMLYRKNIESYLEKGYARRLTEAEAAHSTDRTWYLPHFGVLNPNKPGKLRLVFDAAAMVNGVSLNSMLLKGPDKYQSLTSILFSFRIGRVAVCGDIREMFHQIRIRPEDQNAQRFLWRDGDSTKAIETFVMDAMTFGASCSPCSAQYVKDKNADEHRHLSAAAVEAIKRKHYVDDYVASFGSVDEAIAVTESVVQIHRRGGFELRGFVSNRPEVLSRIGERVETSGLTRLQPDTETDKILGMYWGTEEDCFLFKTKFFKVHTDTLNGKRRPTKREVLSMAMSVFDPFGFLADFMIHAKLIIQELWKTGTGWDEPLPDAIYAKWSRWQSELPATQTCSIPRCYSPFIVTSSNVQLHIFADSSESAFAAVAYWRVQRPDDGFDVSLVAGKTKCAPQRLLSVPRLELQAAVLATRLLATIRSCHSVQIARVVLWTDSQTVLQWIRSDHRRYKPFVAHRVAEILDSTTTECWRWIPTLMNVADDATRAKNPPQFDPHSRWLLGPDFLRMSDADWPAQLTSDPAEPVTEVPEELRSHCVNLCRPLLMSPLIRVIDRYSTFEKTRRVAAWLRRYAHNLLAKSRKEASISGELTAFEMRAAESVLIKGVQSECFAAEMDALEKNRPIDPTSSLRQLMPYLDDDGVMRVYSRLRDARCLPEETVRPIILPKQHRLTTLIVAHHHRRMHHLNQEAVICAIRQRFWVPHIRTIVRRVRIDCQWCKIRAAKPVAPVMGALPADRVTPFVRPFTYTGLDYFGPIYVTIGRRREKRWVALFTCLTIRAVHLEIAADLSTDSCILCIRNFVNIRGVPVRIRSDNGTNFVGARREFQNCTDLFDHNALRLELATQGIEWVFNCPANPEAGGCWERLVQSVKKVLAVSLCEMAPRVETLRSVLLEAANIVNSRPLTHVPVSSDDDEPLTPNHFLIGCSSSTQTPEVVDPKLFCLRKQWRIAQQIKNMFWSRWIAEYLPDLTRRTKWFSEQPAIKEGDLVIICDESQSRNRWRRGRVVNVVHGRDGRIRSASVATSDGVLKRRVCKLAVLDVNL